MTDVVKRLREHANRVAGDGPSGPRYDPETLCLEQEAADEIERLRGMIRITHRVWRFYGMGPCVCAVCEGVVSD